MSARNWNSAKPTPSQRQRQAQLLTGYGAIHLVREEHDVVVKIETLPGEWIDIIREPADDYFSHTIHPIGIKEMMIESGFDPVTGARKQ